MRHGTLVWIAWYLYYTGHQAEMISYLQQAWSYRSHSGISILIIWIESFADFARNWGVEFDASHLTSSPEWQALSKSLLQTQTTRQKLD